MNKNIYLVECSKGSWESFHSWVDSIWDTNKGANNRCKSLNSKYENLIKEAPINPDSLVDEKEKNLNEEDFEKWYNGEYDEMYKIYFQYWHLTHSEFEEFNSAVVNEFNLNNYG